MQQAVQGSQSEAEAEEKKLKIAQEFQEINNAFTLELQEAEYNRKERLEHIKGQYQIADTDTPGDTIDPLAVEANAIKAMEVGKKSDIEREKIISAEKIAESKNETERYKADTSLKVAKENKNKFDTPKAKSTTKA